MYASPSSLGIKQFICSKLHVCPPHCRLRSQDSKAFNLSAFMFHVVFFYKCDILNKSTSESKLVEKLEKFGFRFYQLFWLTTFLKLLQREICAQHFKNSGKKIFIYLIFLPYAMFKHRHVIFCKFPLCFRYFFYFYGSVHFVFHALRLCVSSLSPWVSFFRCRF